MRLNFFRHYPRGFNSLYWAQCFFNFSFYGLKSVFILYMLDHFSFKESQAIELFSSFMALCYATSLLGGYLADKGLGPRKAIILGGLFNGLGLLFFISTLQDFYFLGLAFISLGAGLFKPNLSTSVGLLFKDPKDYQKDEAFSTYYTAMNLGGLTGPLVAAVVSKIFGWPYAFFLMILAFLIGTWSLYRSSAFSLNQEKPKKLHSFWVPTIFTGLLITLYLLFKYQDSFHSLMGSIAIGSFFYLAWIFAQCGKEERKNILYIVLYIILFAFFCSLFEQAASSLLLFFEKAVDRRLIGFDMPSSAFLSLGPLCVLILNPLNMVISRTFFKRKKLLNGFMKMGIGFILVGLSFLILSLSCYLEREQISLQWVILAFTMQTLGELWIVPIGFSNISKLAPEKYRSVMMSFWLMAIAYGHYFAGFIARFSVKGTLPVTDNFLEHYNSFFFHLGLIPLGVGALLITYQMLKKI